MIYFVLTYATLLIFLLGHWQRVALTSSLKYLLTAMETRIMAQIDDLRQAETDLANVITTVGNALTAKITDLEAKLATQPLSIDLTSDIQSIKDDAAKLSAFAPADQAAPADDLPPA